MGSSVEVHGDRAMIAHVCAYFVGYGMVPDDLAVVMPDLEQAVIALLERDTDGVLEPMGASR